LLDLSDADSLPALGIDVTDFDDTLNGMAPFQHIGAAAAFLGYDGLLVPSVRFQSGKTWSFIPMFSLPMAR